MVSDGEPLALCGLAATRRGVVGVLPLADPHTCSTVVRGPWDGRDRACLPGAVQELSDRAGPPPVDRAALRAPQPGAGEAGAAGGALAVEQPLDRTEGHARAAGF